MCKIVLADNQAITAAGIEFLLQQVPQQVHTEIAGTKKQLLSVLSNHPKTALVVLDYTLFDFERVDELLVLSEKFPSTHFLLFSDNLSTDLIRRVLYTTNTCSIVFKSSSIEEITTALQYTLRAERFICNRVSNLLVSAKQVAPKDTLTSGLTPTEIEILQAIASGKKTKEIADERNLSFHTIITHRKNIFKKLDVNNVHEATRYAVRAGLVTFDSYSI